MITRIENGQPFYFDDANSLYHQSDYYNGQWVVKSIATNMADVTEVNQLFVMCDLFYRYN